jgi:hypothetical protein
MVSVPPQGGVDVFHDDIMDFYPLIIGNFAQSLVNSRTQLQA